MSMLDLNNLKIEKQPVDYDALTFGTLWEVNYINLEEIYEPTNIKWEYLLAEELIPMLKHDEFVTFQWEGLDISDKKVVNRVAVSYLSFDNIPLLMAEKGLNTSEIINFLMMKDYSNHDVDSWLQYRGGGAKCSEKKYIFLNRRSFKAIHLHHFQRDI
jgi:hypothetical protein